MVLAFTTGVFLVVLVLWDAFETVILPRRVTRRFRLTRAFYRRTWLPWARLASLASGKRRETLLSIYGPLSLPLLLTVWAAGLMLGFALLQWALHSALNVETYPRFATYLYLSGTTFFTLGFGDVVPLGAAGRMLAVLESGTGFAFLALVLGYLPVLYQAFSRREVNISLLDARAGSPPTAGELLRRHGDSSQEALHQLLHDWERWSAELMESHLSYPVLAYFRSQHDNQSWLAALTAILDTSALVMVCCTGSSNRQARLTFAIARHAVVDLSQVFGAQPQEQSVGRLSEEDWQRLRTLLGPAWTDVTGRDGCYHDLSRLRAMYEPYVEALARYLRLRLPRWTPAFPHADAWQTSGWQRAEQVPVSPLPDEDNEHA